MRIVILDCEAVQALADKDRTHHREALAQVQVIAGRKRKGHQQIAAVVPTTVRVEAGLDRTDPTSALFNNLRVEDVELDRKAADVAAGIRRSCDVSPPDAHIGAAIDHYASAGHEVTVVTSDPKDIATVAGTHPITTVRL